MFNFNLYFMKKIVLTKSQLLLVFLFISFYGFSQEIIFNEKKLFDSSAVRVFSSCSADINNDGNIDIIGTTPDLQTLYWWKNKGNSHFEKIPVTSNTVGITSVDVVDFNHDGNKDIIAASYDLKKVLLFKNNGNQVFEKIIIADSINSPLTVCTGDINNDSFIDILCAAQNGTDGVVLIENHGDSVFVKRSLSTTGFSSTSVEICDIDKDGVVDILASNFGSSGGIMWWKNTGNYTFVEHFISLPNTHDVTAGDIDNDNDIDFAAVTCGSLLAIFKNNGNQNFVQQNISTTIGCGVTVCINDINNDNNKDIVTVGWSSNTIAWWKNTNGSFVKKNITTNLYHVNDVILSDLNKDKKIDLISGSYGGKLNYYINSGVIPEGVVLDYDGNIYNKVKIGNQYWLKENIKSVHYSDGTDISDVASYDNSDSLANIFGRLYTWNAAMHNTTVQSSQGVCPVGWHVASDGEWTALENYLGGPNVAGGKLKDTTAGMWRSPNTGATNSSGFTALPGGEYDAYYQPHIYQYLNHAAVFWTSTQYNSAKAKERYMLDTSAACLPFNWFKVMKYSIRCINDTLAVSNIENPDLNDKFEVIPNPAHDFITINSKNSENESIDINIYSVNGILCFKQKFKVNNITINISDLNKGLYFMKIISKSKTVISKLIKI